MRASAAVAAPSHRFISIARVLFDRLGQLRPRQLPPTGDGEKSGKAVTAMRLKRLHAECFSQGE